MLELLQDRSAQWRIAFLLESGESGALLAVRPGPSAYTLTVGLGPREALTPALCRRAGGKAVQTVLDFDGASAALDASVVAEVLGADGISALAMGAELAAYRAPSWKTEQKEPLALYLDGVTVPNADAILRETGVLAGAVGFARDLVNEPSNLLTPADMAHRMAEAAKAVGAEVEVLDEAQIRALNMDAFLTVAHGAAHAPRLIVLRHRGGREGEAPIALVGKGITCDTGGYNLKRPMKAGIRGDMGGAAAVCGALLALAENQIPVNAVAVIPAAENRIAPDSYLPGDVIRSMAGKTIEIGNTDAEGRLILADAMTYAIRKEGAGKVVDIATLTGAVVGMLGFTTAGLLANDEDFYQQFSAAAQASGEQYWRLPIFPEYQKMIETPAADLSNVSSDGCGTITAGLFVGAFTEEKPWIHLDIAGTAWVDAPKWEYQTKGATGAGVTTLYELCRSMAKPSSVERTER